MACAALKRPYTFDLLNSAGSQHPSVASPKRRRCGSVAVNSVTQSSPSPFINVTPRIDRDELAKSVQDEWQRIQRRRKLVAESPSHLTSTEGLPSSSGHLHHMLSLHMLPGMSTSSAASSQAGEHSPSRSESSHFCRPDMSPPYSGSLSPVLRNGREQPTMSVKQVVVLCERLWKEREEKLREEYDNVLNERLAGTEEQELVSRNVSVLPPKELVRVFVV